MSDQNITASETEAKQNTTEESVDASATRDHVWKKPTGEIKNIHLPIESIAEDNEEDPEHATAMLSKKTDGSKSNIKEIDGGGSARVTSEALLPSDSKASIKTENEKALESEQTSIIQKSSSQK